MMLSSNLRMVVRGVLFHEHPGLTSVRFLSSTYFRGKSKTMQLTWLGLGAGVLFGGVYSYFQVRKSHLPITYIEKEVRSLKSFPDVDISRKVVSPAHPVDFELKLFQYATCPFCCKVRAFLDYFGVSYDVIEVNPVLRQQLSWSNYKKVPIVVAKLGDAYEQLNDSSLIVSAIMSHLMDRDTNLREILKFYPSMSFKEDGKVKSEILNRYFLMYQDKELDEETKKTLSLERKWRKWADDTLVHVLSPNVYRTMGEALQTFSWFSEAGDWEKHFPSWERYLIIYVGAFAMWLIGKRLKKRHNLKDDVRQSFYDECNLWMKELKLRGTTFMGGSSPNLADLAVFGILNSVEGSEAFQDVLTHTKIGTWYWAVKSRVENHGGNSILSS